MQNRVNYHVPFLLTEALMTSTLHTAKATADKRNQTLKTATDYIHSFADKVISIEQLCLDTGINKRTLQRAFLDQYGMTPKAYQQSLRLNDAYKILLQSDPETTKVTDVALSQGYWHMRQFGELPSATLKSIYS